MMIIQFSFTNQGLEEKTKKELKKVLIEQLYY